MSKRNKVQIELKQQEGHPIFLSLAMSIIQEIERGRLRPGDILPGTRALAKSLKLNRNTIDAAYHELITQGWVVSEPAKGTFVAHDLPEIKSSRKKAKELPKAIEQVKLNSPNFLLKVSEGSPDPRLMPIAELTRAFRRSLLHPTFLLDMDYGSSKGTPSLRNALSEYLETERGVVASSEDILVTRGSQMGLFLAAAAVISPGEVIAVEDPGYPLAWAAFRAAGARIVGVPVDKNGIDIEKLADIITREPKLKAIYITPHHQYPTTVTLGAGRRLKLLDLAKKNKLTIIEDDYDHEYSFDTRPVLPLTTKAAGDQSVIYLGSLSKLLTPAIRLGYVIARADIIQRMADYREVIDRQGDLPLEKALASMIDEDELGRNTRKSKRIYEQRRNFLADELKRKLGKDLEFSIPTGGLAIWVQTRNGLSAETWANNASKIGLSIAPGLRYSLDVNNAPDAFRIGFAHHNENELQRIVDLLVKAKPKKSHAGSKSKL